MSIQTVAAAAMEEPASIFQSNLPLEAKLERARMELLDLSARNRLLNIPRSAKSAKTLEIVDEHGGEVFRLLVREQRVFTFLSGRAAADAQTAEDEEEIAELAQPENDILDERGIPARHADTKLQTRLTPAGLQKRLLDLYLDARTLEEEQGVNILFLAVGTLKWVDPSSPANDRYAPLVLIPVILERGNAAEKFKLRWRQEDPAPNLSLEAYLDRVHDGLQLPTFEGGEDFDPSAYMAAVRVAIADKPGWAVNEDDIVLGFFSFAKFLMFRDLDPETWPGNAKLADHELLRPLVSEGFSAGAPLLPEDDPVDPHIPPSDMVHIVDSDSSQMLAIHEVRRGRNLVIQGPPGTGKSQTIANVIAAAIVDGKTVLFVAEKMAALEVVKRRLDNTGVGDACLELHSNKANKRAVLENLRRTWELGSPRGDDSSSLNARLTELRDELNDHALRLHEPLGAADYTPYQVIGHLIRLRQSGQQPTDLRLDRPESWAADQVRERRSLLVELAERVVDIGVPAQHVWRGTDLPTALPPEVDRLIARIVRLCEQLSRLEVAQVELARPLEMPAPETFAAFEPSRMLARRLAEAPDLEPAALGSDAWRNDSAEIMSLLDAGARHADLSAHLAPTFSEAAWTLDPHPISETIAPLPGDMTLEAFARAASLADGIPVLLDAVDRLAKALGREATPSDLRGIDEMAKVGERVAAAPDAGPNAFTSDLWDTSTERAADLASVIEALEKARAEIGTDLTDAAWSANLGSARQTLAAHGTSFMRLLSGEWRAADRLVRSFLADPKTSLERRLALLDALTQGQAALAIVKAEYEFGQTVFGDDWRGDRSSSAPLHSLVAWMRSLRGLGAEPRLVASKRPDRDHIGALTRRVVELATAARGPLELMWTELGSAREVVFADAAGYVHAKLSESRSALDRIRNAHSFYEGIAKRLDPSLDRRRENLGLLAAGRAAAAAVELHAPLGQLAFGSQWRGLESDWSTLRSAAEWIGKNLDVYQLAARLDDRAELARRADSIAADCKAFLDDLLSLLTDLRSDPSAAIVSAEICDTPTPHLAKRLATWRDNRETLSKWVAYRSRAERANGLGMADLVARLHAGNLAPEHALPCFEMSYFETIFTEQVKAIPDLAHFDGDLHSRTVRAFIDLDQQRIRQAAVEVVRAHHRRIPPIGGGALGPLGVLKSEIARRRGHMPIRQLMQRAAPAVQALKPVLMMSPLSVAQYLPPGALTFDLLVMDEASQIQPVDALGAIARCRQVVVVGDPQQLPPTTFFTKMTGAANEDDDDGPARVADIESILGLFTARGLPTRMLRWHYRSRHESLIAVSNRQFYENKLFIVPSPYTSHPDLGLRFHYVEGGVFETGTTRTNPIEAKTVARAIIAHAMRHPNQSLGVASFSAAQRRAIMDQLELLRRQLPPEHEAFFQAHPAEPFFVKNLENVQGDERDVIFISVGYGPSAPGQKPPMRFGPLGQDGGERRLNVLISRAKERCEIFASMTDEDIDPDFAISRKGVYAFKLFMHFARTGRATLAEANASDRDEVFEAQVAQALHERGYQVHRNVGISGLFIDLAVLDPAKPDRYLIGIECDGAAYGTARSARDRDRLRQAVLEAHGWMIHRIWTTDWFRRPKEQLDRLVAAIGAAKEHLAAQGEQESHASNLASHQIVSFDRDDGADMRLVALEETPQTVTAYVEAVLSKPAHLVCELHEAPTGIVTSLAEQVVTTEGPVHIDEIVARIREGWGLKRAGARIHDAVRRAIAVAVRQHRLVEDGVFYTIPGGEPAVRDRSVARSPGLRRPETLPPAEIAAALVDIVSRNFGATEEQAILAVSRALGFKATSAQLREVIATVLRDLIEIAVLSRREALIDLGPNAPARNRTPVEPSPVERLIAQGEHERLEFKQTLRWDVRQQIANKKLEEVVIKTLAAFANHEGGTLLIGIGDDGVVTGLEPDFACLGGSQDKFEVHLTNLLNARFSRAFRATKVKVGFPALDGKPVCRLDIQRSRTPVFVSTADQNGSVAERLFVRSGNASHEIPPSQIATYVREHFE